MKRASSVQRQKIRSHLLCLLVYTSSQIRYWTWKSPSPTNPQPHHSLLAIHRDTVGICDGAIAGGHCRRTREAPSSQGEEGSWAKENPFPEKREIDRTKGRHSEQRRRHRLFIAIRFSFCRLDFHLENTIPYHHRSKKKHKICAQISSYEDSHKNWNAFSLILRFVQLQIKADSYDVLAKGVYSLLLQS